MTTRRAQHHEEMRQAIRVAVTMAAVLALLGAIAVARTWALSMAAVLLVMAALIEVIRMEDGQDEAEPELEHLADARRLAATHATAPLPPALPARPEDGRVLVTFRLPGCIEAGGASVVGEFNDWSATADPMAREAGGFTATLLLEPGRTYRYRYLLDGDRWENDWSADAYVPNQFGGDDSLLDLTGEPLAALEGAEHSTASGELVA